MILQFLLEDYCMFTDLHKSKLPSFLQGHIRMNGFGLNQSFELLFSYKSNFIKSWARPALDEIS